MYLLGFAFVFAGLPNSHLVSAGWKWLATKPSRHVSGRTTESTPWSGRKDCERYFPMIHLQGIVGIDLAIFFSNILKSKWYDFPTSPKQLLSQDDQFKPTWKWGENKTFWDFRIQRKHIFVHRETLRAFRCFLFKSTTRRIFAKQNLRRVEVMVRGEI